MTIKIAYIVIIKNGVRVKKTHKYKNLCLCSLKIDEKNPENRILRTYTYIF